MNKKKYITIVLVGVLACVAVFSGIIAARFMATPPFMQGDHGDAISPVKGDKVNFLIVGLDNVGMNTDTIVVATINAKKDKISMMSIPRDTRVTVNGSTMKINAVYGYANSKGWNDEECLIDTVAEVTGIPINYYAIVDLKAFRGIVDALGGVRYNLTRDYYYYDPYQDLVIDLKKGDQVLNGTQAEGLMRFRHDYPRADLERIEVQQSFLKELIKQKLSFQYITKIPAVYKQVSKNVISNLTVDDLAGFGKSMLDVPAENIKTHTLPNSPRDPYVVVNSEETKKLVDEEF